MRHIPEGHQSDDFLQIIAPSLIAFPALLCSRLKFDASQCYNQTFPPAATPRKLWRAAPLAPKGVCGGRPGDTAKRLVRRPVFCKKGSIGHPSIAQTLSLAGGDHHKKGCKLYNILIQILLILILIHVSTTPPTFSEWSEKPPLKVTFGGAGIFFWWELGAVLWLSENYDMSKVPMAGASGGALAATLAACSVDPYKAADVADRLGREYNIWERPLGLMGVWGDIIRLWLDELLPENAADLCRDRVEVVVTTLPFFELDTVSDYTSKEDLIQANMASSHVPLFLDGKWVTSLRGKMCFDGSFHDFLECSNSVYLTCKGNAVLFDYFQDEDLKFDRFDFLSLKNYDEVMRLMEMGYAFAEKKYNRGDFEKFDTSFCTLGGLRFSKLLGMIRRNTPQLLGT